LNSGQNDNSKREHNNKLIIRWRSRASVSVTCNRSRLLINEHHEGEERAVKSSDTGTMGVRSEFRGGHCRLVGWWLDEANDYRWPTFALCDEQWCINVVNIDILWFRLMIRFLVW